MKLLAFGEVLWDCFSNGRKIGGAPFNFCAHAVKQGASADLITALGRDSLGEEAFSVMKKYGIGTKYVACSDYQTGICRVSIVENKAPSYELVYPVAYDDISLDAQHLSAIKAGAYDCFYFGTLALRGKTSSCALFEILDCCCFPEILCDVNLRQRFYTSDLIHEILNRVTSVKISREELPEICRCIGCKTINPKESAEWILEHYSSIRNVIVTLDKYGALAMRRGGEAEYSVLPINTVVSTVGAGDSFIATFCVSINDGFSVKESLDRAVAVSDFVVTRTEAVPDYNINCIVQ